jgi:hypothetical protein
METSVLLQLKRPQLRFLLVIVRRIVHEREKCLSIMSREAVQMAIQSAVFAQLSWLLPGSVIRSIRGVQGNDAIRQLMSMKQARPSGVAAPSSDSRSLASLHGTFSDASGNGFKGFQPAVARGIHELQQLSPLAIGHSQIHFINAIAILIVRANGSSVF